MSPDRVAEVNRATTAVVLLPPMRSHSLRESPTVSFSLSLTSSLTNAQPFICTQSLSVLSQSLKYSFSPHPTLFSRGIFLFLLVILILYRLAVFYFSRFLQSLIDFLPLSTLLALFLLISSLVFDLYQVRGPQLIIKILIFSLFRYFSFVQKLYQFMQIFQ